MVSRAIPSPADVASRRRGRGTLLATAGIMAVGLIAYSTSVPAVGFLAGSIGARGDTTSRQLRRGLQVSLAAFGGDAEEERGAAKASLLDFLDDEGLAEEVQRPEGKATRGRLDEVIFQLERYSPTQDPVYSELVDGEWVVKYSGSYAPGALSSPTRELALFLYAGGYSLGSALSSFASGFWGQSLGIKVPQKKVVIDGGRDVEAMAELEVNGMKSTLKYSAELLPLSGSRMSEEIMSVDFGEPLGKQDAPFELRRTILVSYLDEDLMIVRDESGVPEVLARTLAAVRPQAEVEMFYAMDDTVGNATDAAEVAAAESNATVA